MRISLRDLFWLALLVASATLWWKEHREKAQEIRQTLARDWTVNPIADRRPDHSELKRLAEVKKVARLTNDQLDAHCASLLAAKTTIAYEPCLAEMSRRGMHEELQKHHHGPQAQRANADFIDRWSSSNLELLTALRRAQGHRDPLRIDVSLSDHWPYGEKPAIPTVSATVTNVDVGGQTCSFLQGGDDRGGRRERWRLQLVDEHGRQVADSNFWPINGGGIFSGIELPFGETGQRPTVFDIRRYVAPPRSGRYQLQVLYHNSVSIAHSPSLAGLIVSKSDPVWVVVSNPEEPATKPKLPIPLPTIAMCIAVGLILATSMFRRATHPLPTDVAERTQCRSAWRLAPRDTIWAVVLIAIACGYGYDSLRQSRYLETFKPHESAKWTISLAEPPST